MPLDQSSTTEISLRRGLLSLSPVVVFLVLYLAVSIITGDFYKMPIAVALLVASAWSIVIYGGRSLVQRIDVYSKSAGNTNILYMIWIFVLAGAFSEIAKGIGSVDATVSIAVKVIPPEFIVPGMFVAACFISLAIGTSVGTVVALTPLAVEMAQVTGIDKPFFVAAIIGGAFFGDNLSFISDTTIAATRTQGCSMSDKFKTNIWIALPAALITVAIYMIMCRDVSTYVSVIDSQWYLVIPYLVVIVLSICSVNVTIVLACGIFSALLLGLFSGTGVMEMFALMGTGVDSMGNLIIITLMAAGMLGIVKATGGINFLLNRLTRHINGPKGAQRCIAVLVSLVNICTANNTVAIITIGSISRDICERWGVDPRKAASILDTCSCVTQSLIPYGAQVLMASALAGISPAAPWPYLYYAWCLGGMVILSIMFDFPRGSAKKSENCRAV